MLKKWFFIVNFHTNHLERIEDGIIRSISSKPKVLNKGGSINGLVYEVHAENKDTAFMMFYNHTATF